MFTIKLADHAFAIHNHFDYIEKLCRDYIVDDTPDAIPVRTTIEEIRAENQDDGNWPDAYLETLAVYRKMVEELVDDDTVLFHCSSLALNGQAVLFTAPSGTGKSTHARLWRQRYGDEIVTVNDDKPVLSFGKDEVRVWGTPYGGKDNLQTNTSAPVKGIVILEQAPENSIRRLSPKEALPMLLNQTYHPRDKKKMAHTLDLVLRLIQLPVYELKCTISQEAVTLSHDAVFGK